MSWCLSGGGSRAFVLDLEIVKSTSTSSGSSSSPSSTLSESSNALSTRKPRTPRKRPNQIYNEAAVLLSSVYPTIFPTSLTKPCSTTFHNNAAAAPPRGSVFYNESNELLLPCRGIDHLGFPLHRPLPSYNRIEPDKCFDNLTSKMAMGDSDEFETSSILDEEMELVEGIDSIMGVASHEISEPVLGSISVGRASGIAYGLGFAGLMMRRGVSALRQVDKGDWWRFPVIDMSNISPRLSNSQGSSHHNHKAAAVSSHQKKKKKNIQKQELEPSNSSSDTFMEDVMQSEPPLLPNLTSSLILKLNYKEVLNAWSDRGSPFDEPDMSGPNAHAMMLAQIDLFGEGGGVREASVLRYKEKRRTRLFSKKIIRYQVRKVNADCRPRMKGRFVRRPTMKKI
ncbi:hypothetical protein QQ045_013082 [Rhodiola kirilowii]